MNAFPIDPEADAELQRRMASLGVREEDLQETFVRSGGHGGQNVNKTSTCVVLRHGPTGLQVKCQTTRHQGRNRVLARQLLVQKIEEARQKRREEARARLEKIRRQKRPRSRAAKQRILANKAHRALKKESRRRIQPD